MINLQTTKFIPFNELPDYNKAYINRYATEYEREEYNEEYFPLPGFDFNNLPKTGDWILFEKTLEPKLASIYKERFGLVSGNWYQVAFIEYPQGGVAVLRVNTGPRLSKMENIDVELFEIKEWSRDFVPKVNTSFPDFPNF